MPLMLQSIAKGSDFPNMTYIVYHWFQVYYENDAGSHYWRNYSLFPWDSYQNVSKASFSKRAKTLELFKTKKAPL